MDGVWLVRSRWRLRGAWMWPTFVVLAVADGIIGHALPIAGDTESVFGGIVLALLINLVVVVLLTLPAAVLLRRVRGDLPMGIARNYGGTACIAAVTVVFAVLGLVHHSAIAADRAAMRDAVTRAAAYIGARAPAPFRANAAHTDTLTIQPGVVYRTCVFNRAGTHEYCVTVNEDKPLERSITPDGSESNAVMALGLN